MQSRAYSAAGLRCINASLITFTDLETSKNIAYVASSTPSNSILGPGPGPPLASTATWTSDTAVTLFQGTSLDDSTTESIIDITEYVTRTVTLYDTTATISSMETVRQTGTDFPFPEGECKGSTINVPNANILWWQDGVQTYTIFSRANRPSNDFTEGTGTTAHVTRVFDHQTIFPDYLPNPSLGAAVTAVVDVANTDSVTSLTPFNPSTVQIIKAYSVTAPGGGPEEIYTV